MSDHREREKKREGREVNQAHALLATLHVGKGKREKKRIEKNRREKKIRKR